MDYEVVTYEVAGGVATVTLNNPEKRNMLSGQHLAGEHVALLRVVQGHRGDPGGDLVGDDLVVHPGRTIADSSRKWKVLLSTSPRIRLFGCQRNTKVGRAETSTEERRMATATNGSKVIKPDHGAGRKHFIFSQEHEDLRDSMRAWVQKEMWPHRNEWEDSYWPTEVMKRAGELGFLGLCFPEEYGGQGGDYYYSLVRAECMSYSGSGGTNMGFAVQSDMVLPPIHLLGTEEQKRRYLEPGLK